MPTVSTIIPCFNQGRFLRECIESALAQAECQVEIIVVNDGSSDATAEVASLYKGRIRYIEQTNRGLSAARNAGLRIATGDYLHFLDADDFIRPGMYGVMVRALQLNQSAVAASCRCRFVNIEGADDGEYPERKKSGDFFHDLLAANQWPPLAHLVRKAAIDKAGEFDPEMNPCEDWDMWLRIIANGGAIVGVDKTFAAYRRHPNSLSRNAGTHVSGRGSRFKETLT